ncbi:MAG: IPT/TIG domain-containing protein [Verrucomicrobiota bacterium]
MQAGAAISGFFPTSGPVGTVVTVNGSGFSGATNFLFNGATYADFQIISSGQLQVVVPLGAGSGPLSVVVAGVTSASAGTFTVAPYISSFNPASGAYPTAVTIFGGNFVMGGTTVTFTGASPVNGMVTAQNQVVAVVPTNAADGPITVSTSAGTAVTAGDFVVSAAPTITAFSPAFGTNGTTVVIDGSNFVTNGTTVKFGGSNSTSVTVVAATQLQAVVPNGATNGLITVSTTNGVCVSSNVFRTGFTSGITDFNPSFGAANANVIIDGFGFNSMTKLIFAGVTLLPGSPYITASNDTQIQLVVPPGASNGPITVVSAHGSFTTSSNFLTSPGPVILDFNPAAAGPGTNVTLDGFNFATGMSVKFGGKSAAGFTVTQPNQLQVAVPTGATNAPISVSLGSSTFTTSSNFIVTGAGPIITGFSPSNGVQGMTVTISGSFASLGAPGVEFNGTAASYTPLTSYNQVQAVVPPAATSGPISLLNSGGTGLSSTLFYLQPWITNFTPSSAIANATVTITGRNFTNATALTVNGVPWSFTATSNQITATVPANASTGLMMVSAPGGNFIDTNVFKVLPKINSFSPLVGPTNSVVSIYGTGLLNVTNVQFNGVNARPSSASNSQVQVVVPYNAASGPLTVFTPDGSSVSAASFAVTRPSLVVLAKTASSPVLGPGTNVVYTLTVTNEGPSLVSGLTISDPLPASLNYISASSTLGACSFSNGVVTCNAGILTNNFGLTVTITGNASASGDLVNTASLNFLEGNLNPQDNTASAKVVYLTDPQRTLGIQRLTAPPGVVLSWPSSSVSFLLEYSTNLGSPANWQTNTSAQTVIGGQIYVTNTTAGPSTFFQLKAR